MHFEPRQTKFHLLDQLEIYLLMILQAHLQVHCKYQAKH